MWFLGVAARAESPAGEADESESEHGSVAARVIGGESAGHPVGGGGLAIEALVGRGFGLELTGAVLAGEGEREVPLELVLEHALVAGRAIEPYIGVGPTLIVAEAEGERSVELGGVGVVGAKWWFGHRAGLLLEADAVAFHGEEAWHAGAEALGGVAVRF